MAPEGQGIFRICDVILTFISFKDNAAGFSVTAMQTASRALLSTLFIGVAHTPPNTSTTCHLTRINSAQNPTWKHFGHIKSRPMNVFGR